MHELSLAENMVDTALGTNGVSPDRLRAINITCGVLAGVNLDSLRFGLELAFQQRGIDALDINIEEVEAQLQCKCGSCYTAEEIFCECPQCGGTDHRVTGGTEITIESVEVEDEQNRCK